MNHKLVKSIKQILAGEKDDGCGSMKKVTLGY